MYSINIAPKVVAFTPLITSVVALSGQTVLPAFNAISPNNFKPSVSSNVRFDSTVAFVPLPS
jgi:hypothetical protein